MTRSRPVLVRLACVARSFTSSSARIAPSPRASPTNGNRSEKLLEALLDGASDRGAALGEPVRFSMTSIAASAAAQETGFPA